MPITPLAENFIEDSIDVEYQKQITLSVDALEEVRNYGSQLFQLLHKGATIDHPVAVQLFYLRKMLEIIDSISILVKAQSSPDSPLRTLFECVVYITHIMERETENRSLAFFYVTSVENEIKNNKFNPNTLTGKETKAALKKEQKGDLLDSYIDLLEEKNKGLQNFQTNPTFKHVAREYQKVKKLLNNGSKKEQRPPWYYLFGGSRSFKDLCDRLGFQGEYKIKYDYLSEAVHAQNILQPIELVDEYYIKYPLFRNFQEYRSTVNGVFLSSFKIYQAYLRNDPDSINSLKQWGLFFSQKYQDVLHPRE